MDALALETLSLKPASQDSQARQKAEKTAGQFEDVFIRTLVKSLRETASFGEEGGMFGSGPGADTYADWFDERIAGQLREAGGIGIADVLLRDMEQNGEIAADRTDLVASKVRELAEQRPLGAARSLGASGKGGFDVVL
ncbi:MAG: rod-binding protein [Planctomycetota bacterium]